MTSEVVESASVVVPSAVVPEIVDTTDGLVGVGNITVLGDGVVGTGSVVSETTVKTLALTTVSVIHRTN